jgi:predicted transposase YbfD/YdcC
LLIFPEPRMAISRIMTHFCDLPDPRKPLGKRHVLSDMLVIAICAVICGAEGWSQVAAFGRAKRKWFESFLQIPHGIPSHDTFGRVFAALDPQAFERCFMSWVSTLVELSGGKLVSFDGKSIRHSFDHAWDASGMVHLVSAFVGDNRLVLGQSATDGKDGEPRGNEITAIEKLLDLLDVSGATVSIDAIGCQRVIAQKIVHKHADYLLCVKENQPTLHAKVKHLLDEAILDGQLELDCFEEVDGEHGRIETRRVWATNQVQHLMLPDPWPHLLSLACVERVREVIGGPSSIERSYYISSIKGADAVRMARAIRGHWAIENQLHWHLDVSFDEDGCRIRTDHAAENFSRLRRIALNQLQREKTLKGGIKTKRLNCGWDHHYLLKVLSA